jgi:hypothetical protein
MTYCYTTVLTPSPIQLSCSIRASNDLVHSQPPPNWEPPSYRQHIFIPQSPSSEGKVTGKYLPFHQQYFITYADFGVFVCCRRKTPFVAHHLVKRRRRSCKDPSNESLKFSSNLADKRAQYEKRMETRKIMGLPVYSRYGRPKQSRILCSQQSPYDQLIGK